MAENDSTAFGGETASTRLIDAALELAAETGWRRLTMAAIADRAGLPLNQALRVHGSRNEVLRAMGRHVDAAMLDEALSFTDQDGPRDRLFDMLMRRFDALSPWRKGLSAIIRDLPTDPVTFMVSMQGVYHSMGLALEAASLPADGFNGLATRKGLAAVYLSTMRVWTEDDTEDLSRTMATLDKNLDRAESVMSTLCRVMPCGTKGGRKSSAPPPAPDADAAWMPEDSRPDDKPSSGGAPA